MLPDEGFIELVRDFLTHLHDYGYLQMSSLVDMLTPRGDLDSLQSMRGVRSLVLTTLDQMNPGSGVSFRSPHARAHSILKLHYVEGLTVMEVALELAISERTLYRELRKAERDLAVLLWDSRQTEVVPQPAASGVSPTEPVLQEAQRIGSGAKDIYLDSLLQGALMAVDRLGQQREVRVEATPVDGSEYVCVDPLLARQVLINSLSHAIQNSQPGTVITTQARRLDGKAVIQIDCQPSRGMKTGDLFPNAAQQLVQRLGGQWSTNIDANGQARIAFTLGGKPRCRVLVIDDNENLLELFQRYLMDEDYQLISARDGQEGLRLAEQSDPDVVILDVMMPQNDGWEVLQWFQAQKNTSHVPIVVCSVLDDPELAFSLGAAGFLSKPVARATLLEALSRYRPRTQPPSDPGFSEGT